MITIKQSKGTNLSLNKIYDSEKIHQQGIVSGLYTFGKILGNHVKQLIEEGPKTGRIYSFRGSPHQASAPGEAPANKSGTLVESYNYNVRGAYEMEVGESAPYAGFLEDGTTNIEPRPHFKRAIDDKQGDLVNILYSETDKELKKR